MSRFSKTIAVVGSLLVIVGIASGLVLAFNNSHARRTPLVYANSAELLETYNYYKKHNIEPSSGRTYDSTQNNITTSEAQSYTMLRAVYMDDQTTFDSSWKFTRDNMQRSDYLFSWKYGQISGSKYGILTDQGGQNTASDGDIEIALSLLMAYNRWTNSTYLAQAEQIIASIYKEEVVVINGQPVLVADDLERNNTKSVVVNPSYFDVAAFKLFAKVSPTQNWTGLADNSYTILNKLSNDPLGTTKSSGLPPNWITINRSTGALIPNANSNLDTNFGYDAFRVPFRLALDYAWFNDPRDKQTLAKFSYLQTYWNKNQKLAAIFGHDGSVLSAYEAPSMYGATIGYFNVIDPATAKQVYASKLQTLYSPDQQAWKTRLSYYDDNWAWFGIALTQGQLPNLTDQGN